MDITSIGGIIFAIAAILVGQALEGGHVGSILQLTAAMIVFGGTIGAVAVAFPKKDFLCGMRLSKMVFVEKGRDMPGLARQLVEYAGLARRDGVLALEGKLGEVADPFMRRALQFVVDGVDASVTRGTLESAIDAEYEEHEVGAKVWESMGGFAPTVGILGAVLGLIHVMENLNDPSKLGGGIATAFVATVYGVGSANLFFLPFATKIKRKLKLEQERKNLIMEGVLSIQEGINPRVLEEKLRAFTGEEAGSAEGEKKAA